MRGDTVANPREQEEKRRQTNGEHKLLVKKNQIIDEIKVHLTKLTCRNQNATEEISLKTNKTSSTVRGSSS